MWTIFGPSPCPIQIVERTPEAQKLDIWASLNLVEDSVCPTKAQPILFDANSETSGCKERMRLILVSDVEMHWCRADSSLFYVDALPCACRSAAQNATSRPAYAMQWPD